MNSSVSKSTAAVASSRTKILLFLSRARARHTNWRWPTLKHFCTVNLNYLEKFSAQGLFKDLSGVRCMFQIIISIVFLFIKNLHSVCLVTSHTMGGFF